MNSEHRSCLCKGASCKHLMTKSYGGHFLHALSTLTLSPLRKVSPFISLWASPQGWERLCHSSMGLSLQGPWHGHSHVSSTHSLRTALTRGFLHSLQIPHSLQSSSLNRHQGWLPHLATATGANDTQWHISTASWPPAGALWLHHTTVLSCFSGMSLTGFYSCWTNLKFFYSWILSCCFHYLTLAISIFTNTTWNPNIILTFIYQMDKEFLFIY